MKYNEKYNRYVTKGSLVYRYDSKQDKLVLCNIRKDKDGYLQINVCKPKKTTVRLHRLVYETFVGEIPEGYTIDHINTIKDDNRLENLRCVTMAENNKNPITKEHRSEASKGLTRSDFGVKFKEHYGITRYQNDKLYSREYWWYITHNKCRREE